MLLVLVLGVAVAFGVHSREPLESRSCPRRSPLRNLPESAPVRYRVTQKRLSELKEPADLRRRVERVFVEEELNSHKSMHESVRRKIDALLSGGS